MLSTLFNIVNNIFDSRVEIYKNYVVHDQVLFFDLQKIFCAPSCLETNRQKLFENLLIFM